MPTKEQREYIYHRLREAVEAAKVLKENVAYFGYGYIKDVNDLVPNVPLTFYAFRVMVKQYVTEPSRCA